MWAVSLEVLASRQEASLEGGWEVSVPCHSVRTRCRASVCRGSERQAL